MKKLITIMQMKKVLLSLVFLLFGTMGFSQKKIVGIYLKDLGINEVTSFEKIILPRLNNNDEMEFVLTNSSDFSVTKPFEYLLNITVSDVKETLSLYDRIETKTVDVKGSDGKVKKVEKKERKSGLSAEFSVSIFARAVEVSSGEYIFGWSNKLEKKKEISDPLAHNITLMKRKRDFEKAGIAEKSIKKKHNSVWIKFRDEQREEYFMLVTESILNAAAVISFPLPYVTKIVKEKNGKAKILELKGSKYAVVYKKGPKLAVVQPDGTLKSIGSAYSNKEQYFNDRMVIVNGGKKEVYSAFEEGKKIVAMYSHLRKQYPSSCAVLEKEIHVASVIDIPKNTIKYGRQKLAVQTALSNIGGVRVFEREDTPDLSMMLQSAESLDEDFIYSNRDKLVGVDYVLVYDDQSISVLNVESSIFTKEGKEGLIAENSMKGTVKELKSALKNIWKLKPATSLSYDISMAISNSLGILSIVDKIEEEKNGKAIKIGIKSLTSLEPGIRYKVFRIDDEQVGDKIISREVEIGEIRILAYEIRDKLCSFSAKVLGGDKEILKAFNEGKVMIVK